MARRGTRHRVRQDDARRRAKGKLERKTSAPGGHRHLYRGSGGGSAGRYGGVYLQKQQHQRRPSPDGAMPLMIECADNWRKLKTESPSMVMRSLNVMLH